jgi:hypothetical protein
MDFVWIYIKSLSAWDKTGLFNELEWSIKSVRKNYGKDVRCFVVGDDPGLPDIIHVPAQRIEISKRGYSRHFDVIRKLQAVLPLLGPEFVLMYDDIFILHPITKDQLKTVYARCQVEDIDKYVRTRVGDMSYKGAFRNTLIYIRDSFGREDIYDWETHLPRYFVTEGIRKLIYSLRLDQQAYFITSLYPAYYSNKPDLNWQGIQSDMWTWGPGLDLDKEFSKQFLNIGDDALVNPVIDKIKECLN